MYAQSFSQLGFRSPKRSKFSCLFHIQNINFKDNGFLQFVGNTEVLADEVLHKIHYLKIILIQGNMETD